MDHRVEPPSWLPEGAAPEDVGAAPGDSTVSAESPADKLSYSNGRDETGSYEYSYDSSYADSQDSSFGSNQDSSFGGEDNSFAGREGSLGSKSDDPFAGREGSLGSKSDDPFGTTQDGSYGTKSDGSFGSQDSSFGSNQDSSFGGQDDSYGSTAGSYGQDAAFGSRTPATDSNHTAEPPRPLLNESMATTYSTRLVTEQAPASDPPPVPAASTTRTAQATSAYSFSSTPAAAAKPKVASVQPRRANLVISRLEPWSVMKFSFLISLVAWIVLFVAVAILYYALSGLGVFESLQKTLSSVTSSQASGGVSLSKWTSASRVLGYTMLIGAVNVVLITALSTVGAMIYNLVTHLGGGIEVTLRETD